MLHYTTHDYLGRQYTKSFQDTFKFNIKKIYFHMGNKKIYKSYGYVKNSAFQIFKLANTKNYLFNGKIYYICDYETVE